MGPQTAFARRALHSDCALPAFRTPWLLWSCCRAFRSLEARRSPLTPWSHLTPRLPLRSRSTPSPLTFLCPTR